MDRSVESGQLCRSPLGEALLGGDLARVDVRQELPLLRQLVAEAAEHGLDLVPLFRALAGRDPLALADLATGPRAVASDQVVRAALAVAGRLEQQMAPAGLYRRLLALAHDEARSVLRVAVKRHPTATWLVSLSQQCEGDRPGEIHLLETVSEPAFEDICRAHAQAGHFRALLHVAQRCGCPEPVVALIAVDRWDLALQAATAVLDRDGHRALGPYVAAVWGPDAEVFFLRLVPRLKSRRAAQALLEEAAGWPRCRELLERVIPGMRQG